MIFNKHDNFQIYTCENTTNYEPSFSYASIRIT